ncbi:MAG: ferredoxin, partial [Deltaproteobacteria bacterium]|nr:ferredoxin [Deltaproteobacteria bacterium]
VDEKDEIHILLEEPPESLHEKVRAAVRLCPRQALSLDE